MDYMTQKAVAARILVTAYMTGLVGREGRDRGQASTEYAGVLFVVAAIVAAVIAVANTGIGAAIATGIQNAVNQVTGGAPAA